MSRYFQLIVFLTVHCIKNNCDQTESSPGYQLKCKNEICSESIGLVVATQNYRPDERHKLKYNIEDKIEIFGTTVDGQYYFAKLNDRQGLVSKKLVREVKQFHKDDDLILTHLDDTWKPIIKVESSDEDSFIQSSTSSVEEEITSNSADDVSISENMEIKPDILSVSDSPIDKLQTSFQPGNNQEEPTSSLQDFQHDQMKTVDSSIVVKSEEITKSQPQQANTDIVPTMPSIASDPPRLTTEVDGTTFPVDEYIEDEVSLQSSTPTPSMDSRPPPFLGYSGQNNGIGPSDIPSRSESPNQQTLGALNLSPSVEMSNINKVDQLQESNDFNKIVTEKSPELSPSVVDESTTLVSSSLPSQRINTDDHTGPESHLSPQSESSSDEKGTGFIGNVNSQPSETTTATLATESSSPAAVEEITDSQNGYTSNSIYSDQLIDKHDKPDVNNIESNESNLKPQAQNQNQAQSTSTSTSSLSIGKPRETNGGDQYDFQSDEGASKIQESHKDESVTNEVHHHGSGETGGTHNPQINEVSSTPPPILEQEQQLPASPQPSINNQQQPLSNKDEPVDQYNHPNYHHQTVHQQQQPQRPPIIGTNDDYKHNNQPDYPSDEMTHQMAADVKKQSYLSPSSSLYLPPQQESVTTDIPLSSLPPSPDSDSSLLSTSVNNQNFDSNLALPMQSSSLLSNSASPSDQQSTFNGASESLTDSFTQKTFTEPSISTNYPDAMRSQITLLTTLLPEPVIDYLHHVNFSPSIFVILLMITITWLVMFITSKILSSHKEKVSLEDQLCRNHGENFNLKTERDYLFDELAAEKEKNSRLLKEHLEIKDKFENINHHIEHSESEKNSLISKLESLVNETRKQKQRIEQLEKNNETLRTESSEGNDELTRVKLDLDKLSKELEEKTDSLEVTQMEIEKYAVTNEQLTQELAILKKKETQLEIDLKRMVKQEETIEKLTMELENAEQEINSMKSFIDNTNESAEYSLESLLDGIKLKAELSVAQKQLKSLKEEKDELFNKTTDMETRLTKAEVDSNEAIKAKDEAERRLQILKTYFNEQEVKLQSELGTWKLKYEEMLSRNESVPGYIEDLKRSNESLKNQVESLEREIAKREEKHRVDCSKLERDKHELYMSKIRVVDDLKNLKSECEILRKKLTLKSQGYSDDDLKHSTGMDGSTSSTGVNLDSLPPPPPPPTGYLEDTLDSSATSGPWSLGTIDPPPPFPVSWMNSGDSSTSGYSSLPPAPMPLQQHQPSNHHHYPSHHHHSHYPPAPQMPPMRDTYSPSSQRSHDQRSVRSDISFSSTNNSHHHYPNYGPPPPLPPQTVQGPFSNPIPSHWSVNTQQQQQQQQQQQYQNPQQSQSSHNESSINYDSRNYYTGGR